MKHLKIIAVMLVMALSGPAPAGASVIGAPQCAADVEISHQERGLMTGTLVNVRALDFTGGFPGGDFCAQFAGADVRITGNGNYAELMMERARSLTLGVQQGSSMGAGGPVMFLHWNIISMKEGGKDVAKEVFPAITVTLPGE